MTTEEIIMSNNANPKALAVMSEIRSICVEQTGKEDHYKGKSGSYKFIMGRDRADGGITAVVHKVLDNSISKVAGSIKIDPNGEILRFTGMPRKSQLKAMTSAESKAKETAQTKVTA